MKDTKVRKNHIVGEAVKPYTTYNVLKCVKMKSKPDLMSKHFAKRFWNFS